MIDKNQSVLITGGCGYIGSHVTCLLSESGYSNIVLDNLSTGRKDALLHQEKLIVGDLKDTSLLSEILQTYPIRTIFHFAASIAVEESVIKPCMYYENNTVNFFNLLKAVDALNRPMEIILSSTAAVYGESSSQSLQEMDPTTPANPYGRSKLMDEWILADIAKANPKIKYTILRYFNVAGADAEARIGQCTPNATHLIKVACEVLLGKKKQLTIFGEDYSTPDGTCIRDYIHVEDLADAHLEAKKYLERGGANTILNCGYNQGYSVKEVIYALEEISGKKLDVVMGTKRDGDVASLIANNTKILRTLSWKPKRNNLQTIISSALAWERTR